ncbi:MAG TPA: alanine--glyoxylate aminotransferase family protein [Thermoplasmata archaeon]|nr:alanine--glyoxylate aminotransferase family protein [Thermoplasmata archaeon]
MDVEDTVFLLPGPVKMHPRVLRAMAMPAINHRSAAFQEVLGEVRELTKYLFQTSGRVAVLSGSGTAGLDAAASGLLRRGDRVLCLVNGKFSERFHDLCKVYAKPTALEFEWGHPVDPARVSSALEAGDFKAVTVCHNETSTGLTNPVKEIAAAAREHGAMMIVDGITSVGGIDVRLEWGIDALVMGSQKCVAAPPGLAAVAVSERAYGALHQESSFYTDLKAHLDAFEEDDTPYTPAVPLFFAFREALRILKEEGLEARIARTTRLGEATRRAVEEIDLAMLPRKGFESNTVSAIRYPPGVDDKKFRTILEEEHRTVVQGGQEHLKGKIFRIGHMGIVSMADLVAGFAGIESTLAKLGHKFDRGAGVAALTNLT